MKKIAIFHPAARDNFNTNLRTVIKILSENYIIQEDTIYNCSESKHDEFIRLICDESVDIIMAWRGGQATDNDLSRSSLELNKSFTAEDISLIKSNKPIIVGRSDITYLHSLLVNLDIVSYYGPCLESALAEESDEFVIRTMIDMMRKAIESHSPYTINFADPLLCPKDHNPWTLSGGTASGRLVGGNLDTIYSSIQNGHTESIPIRKSGDLVFLEEVDPFYYNFNSLDDNPSPYDKVGYIIDKKIDCLVHNGFFDNVSAILIGRSKNPSFASLEKIEEKEEKRLIENILIKHSLLNVPILANVACSHTSPMVTLPLGKNVLLDATNQTLTIK